MEDILDKKQSKYNEAMLQIMRLNDSWVRCNNFATSGQFIKWRSELDVIWRELFADIKKIEPEKEEVIKKLFSSEVKTIYDLHQELKDKIKEAKTSEIYDAIDARHRFLKDIQDAVGKGAVFSDLNEDGM